MFSNLFIRLDHKFENKFHDSVVGLVKEGTHIGSIKENIMHQLTEYSDFEEGNFLKAEISGGLTKSGNQELVEFWISETQEREEENGDITLFVLVEF